MDAELRGKKQNEEIDNVEEEDTSEFQLRHSNREIKLTEKMMEYRQQEFEKKERKFVTVFEQWRKTIKQFRNDLKHKCTETVLCDMIDDVKRLEDAVLKQFRDLRAAGTVTPETVRKVDACYAINIDLLKIVNERLCAIENFDSVNEAERLRALRRKDYAKSIFSSSNDTERSSSSTKSKISERMVEATAELAAKKAEYRLLEEEELQRAKLCQLEYEQKRALEAQHSELKRFEARKQLEIANARVNAYDHMNDMIHNDEPLSDFVVEQEPTPHLFNRPSTQPNQNSEPGNASVHDPSQQVNTLQQTQSSLNTTPYMNQDTNTLAKAIAESVNLSRLPVPEPSVFTGDPLQYIEWKTSFEMLIERKGIPPQEKIFYLKKYLGGAARKALEGFFYSSSQLAYENARKVLDERYGHPFIMQKAFRDKLDRWPRIAAKDPIALRDFADFLQGCRDATPHIPSLSILNDCTENKKLLSKLPDWASLRWNRQVTKALDETGSYPSFKQFVEFIVSEARVACNPISSLYALEPKASNYNNNRVKVLATTAFNHDKSTYATDGKTVVCDYCKTVGHHIFKCERFLLISIGDKRSYVRDNNLCFGCLRKGHLNKDCKRKHTCGTCRGKHPTCLHEDRHPINQSSNKYSVHNVELKSASSFRVSQNNGQSTSMIVPVWVSYNENPSREILTYALLDTQSDTTFIVDDTVSALQIPCKPVKLSLSTMTAQHTVIESFRVCGLQVRAFKSSEHDKVSINQAYTRNFIPADHSHIPDKGTVKDWPHLQQITNDLPPLQSCEVGLLIGYNCPQALAPRKILIGQDNEPYAVQTQLGWSIVGYSNTVSDDSTLMSVCNRSSVKELSPFSPNDLINVLEKDFAQDKCQNTKVSQEDINFLSIMDSKIFQRDDGHIEMPLPFKERPTMPNNRPLALIRLNHLKRKLKNDQRYYDHYKQFMKEMIDRGDAEIAEVEDVDGNRWYIPHHGVYHSKKPNKLRVVFDCSAKYHNSSLNQYLLTGPDLTNGLIGVLCRFRRHPVAIMCDVERMFHQFIVPETDRDFLRFLWWKDGDICNEREPLEYRMKVHLFGAASSPGCANYGLKYLAKTQEKEFLCGAYFVQHDFYVDDGLTSVETNAEAIQLIHDAQALCANGGLRLHKFISNQINVINSIPISERAVDVKNLNLAPENFTVERALGVQWCIEEDIFSFQIKIKDTVPTRRNMLSIVASIFDPLGFLSPFTLKGKRMLQKMCQNGVGWDDPLPKCATPEWENWIDDIQNLQFVKIPRCVKPSDFGMSDTVELHHFSDASNTGYGQCSYIRFVKEDKVHCSLLMAKARVAPHKVVTIPRLELTAAVLSVKMSMFLKEELDLEIKQEYFWTDSKVVLGYIKNEARRFHVFVANRVQMIREGTNPDQWFYVNSENNPADHASRGLSAFDIAYSTWLTGPSFLWKSEIEIKDVDTELQLGDPEVKSIHVRSLWTETGVPTILERLDIFSSWFKTVSVIARLQRLSNGVKGTQSPSVEERCMAQIAILKLVQHEAFRDSISVLGSTSTLPKTNRLYSLDPILENGLLCIGGRLRKADMPAPYKHPIILPRNSHITQLILTDVHQKAQHQGRGITLNKLRSYGYWIVGGGKVVARFIRQCVVCRRLRRPTESQRMADLPQERVEPSPPFTYCGMDCFGPFMVKQGRKEIKRYGLLFTCMCSRAIHIEMLDDLSTDAFINGLRCFIAIRGAVRQIRSDQGTNFVGARNEFGREVNISKITSFLIEKQCDFVMNAPSSSHTGGVWERQIRTVRNVLNSVLLLCPGRLDDSSLRTIFYEVMSIVNCRPLTVNEIEDPNTCEPLTPNHILTSKSEIPYPPPGKFVKEDLFLRKRWRRVQYILEQFWARWKKEYLAQISLRQRWHEPRRNMRIGDIVLVKDVDYPRNQWPLAKVVEVNIDDDGLVRRVKVKLGRKDSASTSILERSVHKLVLLVEQ